MVFLASFRQLHLLLGPQIRVCERLEIFQLYLLLIIWTEIGKKLINFFAFKIVFITILTISDNPFQVPPFVASDVGIFIVVPAPETCEDACCVDRT
jgi:hypothetical protein